MFGISPEAFWVLVALICALLGLLLLWIRRVRRRAWERRVREHGQRGIQRGVVGNPSILPRQRTRDKHKSE